MVDVYKRQRSYPADTPSEQARYAQEYQLAMHPNLAFAAPAVPVAQQLMLPNDLTDAKNTLPALIAADPLLQVLFSNTVFLLELADDCLSLIHI